MGSALVGEWTLARRVKKKKIREEEEEEEDDDRGFNNLMKESGEEEGDTDSNILNTLKKWKRRLAFALSLKNMFFTFSGKGNKSDKELLIT